MIDDSPQMRWSQSEKPDWETARIRKYRYCVNEGSKSKKKKKKVAHHVQTFFFLFLLVFFCRILDLWGKAGFLVWTVGFASVFPWLHRLAGAVWDRQIRSQRKN